MVRTLGRALALVATPLALFAQENDPPGRAGRVSSVAGTVAFQAAGAPDWSAAPLNYTVSSGDRLLTHQRSRAEIEVGPYDVRLADSTDLSVVNLTDDFTQLGLRRGTIRVSVYRLASRDSMEVDTPNGAIVIRSAGQYRIDVLEGVSTIVSVEDGRVELSGPSLDYTVTRGQTIELTGTTAISANMIPHPRNSDFDQWSADRDRRQSSTESYRYVSRDIPGVADLDHHGHWHYHASYGYVWQPSVVTVGWVPYRHGRWVWNAVWGWTWVEASPWGFAPFHYGRWVVVGGHWVWAPGPVVRRPYYAPALVVFVGGPRYGRYHQAWFPLGWNEPYYPRYRHSDRYLRQVNIANVRNIQNVDDFVDPRRADRIEYRNREATTVVSSDAFGRRPVVHEASNFKPDEVSRAPIARERWESPRIGAQAQEPSADDRQSPLRSRRDAVAPQTPDAMALPTRTGEPARGNAPTRIGDPTPAAEPTAPSEPRGRDRSPLIYRNTPPADAGRTRGGESTERPAGGTLRPRQTLEPAADAPLIDRGRPTVRRNGEPSALPQAAEPAERPRRSGLERSAEPDRPTPERTGSSRPSPRESAPRVSAPPRESAPPRASSPPRESAPSGRSSPSSGGASRLPSRRPPG